MAKNRMLKMMCCYFLISFSFTALANGGSNGGGPSSDASDSANDMVRRASRIAGNAYNSFAAGFVLNGNSSDRTRNYVNSRLNHAPANVNGTVEGSGTASVVSGGTTTGESSGGDNSIDLQEGSYEGANSGQVILKSSSNKSSDQDRCFGIERGNLPEEFRKIVDSTCPNVLSSDYCGCLLSLVSNSSPLGQKIKEDYSKAKKNMMAVNYRSLLKRWSEAYIDGLGVMLSNSSAQIGNENICSPAKMFGSVLSKMQDRSTCKGDPEAFGIAAQSLIDPSSKLDVSKVDFSKIPLQSFLSGMKNGAQSRRLVVAASGRVESFNCLDEGQAAVLSLLPRYVENKKSNNSSKTFGGQISSRYGVQNSITTTDSWIKDIDAEILQNKSGDFVAEEIIKRNRGFAKVLKLFPGLDLLLATLSYAKPYETDSDKLKRLKILKETLSKVGKFSSQINEAKLNSPKMSNRDLIEKIMGYSENVKEFVEKKSTEFGDDIKDVAEAKCGLLQHDLALIACADDTLLDDRAQVLSAFGDAARDRSLGSIENAQNCKSDKEIALQCMTYNYVTCRKQSEIELAPVVDLLGNFKILPGRSEGSVVRRVAESYWRNRVEDEINGDMCSNYTAFMKEKQCDVSESAAQACLLKQNEYGLTSDAYTTWLKRHGLDETDGASIAGARSYSPPLISLDEKGATVNGGSQNQILADIQNSINGANTPSDGTFGSQFLKAANMQSGASAASNNNQANNLMPQGFITPTQTIPQQIAKKDEAIAAKETEISERVSDSKGLQDPVLKSAAEDELKALRAELAALKKEREALASAQQETESQVAENAAASKNSNLPNRSPASVAGSSTGSSFSVGSSGSSSSGGSSASGETTSGSSSGFGSTGSSSGGSATAPTTVQGVLSSIGSGSSALLEANQLKLTVGGQEVAAQNVTTLSIPSGASSEVIQKVIQDNQSKLKFVDGVALVELIGADKKPVYYQVKKQGEGFELIAVKEDIPSQVRKWSASYANFLKKIQTIRGPSGQSTQGRP